MHLDMWYHLNAIRHHDGCRLVHPAKWNIGQFRGAFVMDADWCISSVDSFGISFNSRCQELIDSFTIRFIIHIHSVFKYHISIPYSLSYYLFKYILNLCTYFIYSLTYSFMYSFHILIHVLISWLLGKLPKYLK